MKNFQTVLDISVIHCVKNINLYGMSYVVIVFWSGELIKEEKIKTIVRHVDGKVVAPLKWILPDNLTSRNIVTWVADGYPNRLIAAPNMLLGIDKDSGSAQHLAEYFVETISNLKDVASCAVALTSASISLPMAFAPILRVKDLNHVSATST